MKNRILSVFCAIAMLATMMSAFVVTASAADAPAVTLTVLKQATAEEPAEVQLGYEGFEEGVVIKGIDIVIPLDTTKFTFVEDADSEIVYNASKGNVMYAWFAPNKASYITATSGKIGTFKIKLAEDLAWGEELKVVSNDNATQFTLATGDLKMKGVASTIVVGAGAEAPVKGLAVKLDKTAVTVEPGASAEVTATLENVKNTATITAESDNKDVTVSVKGTKITVTAAKKAADGTANVTVTAKEGDATATAKLVVTVKAKPVEKPAFKTDAETKEETIAGSKVNTFEAKIAPAEGKTAEEISALITGSEYQVIFDGKTDDGYAAGWAIVTISGDALKDALAGDGKLTDVKISIGGADKVAVSILDAEGNTVVLPE